MANTHGNTRESDKDMSGELKNSVIGVGLGWNEFVSCSYQDPAKKSCFYLQALVPSTSTRVPITSATFLSSLSTVETPSSAVEGSSKHDASMR